MCTCACLRRLAYNYQGMSAEVKTLQTHATKTYSPILEVPRTALMYVCMTCRQSTIVLIRKFPHVQTGKIIICAARCISSAYFYFETCPSIRNSALHTHTCTELAGGLFYSLTLCTCHDLVAIIFPYFVFSLLYYYCYQYFCWLRQIKGGVPTISASFFTYISIIYIH